MTNLPLPPSGFSLTHLAEVMRNAGARRLYVKKLASNDNSKNQIYFGPGFEALNIFPNRGVSPDSGPKNPIFKAGIDFSWIDEAGTLYQAPNAQLILYPQYPEVRMSGFLLGCQAAPSLLMTSRDVGRILFLGIRPDGRILGYVAPVNSAMAHAIEHAAGLAQVGVFQEIPIGTPSRWPEARAALLEELRRIHALGWIDSKRLNPDRSLTSCNSSNCGGYTLEAELGITPNGFSEPDYLGWEVKQHGVKDLNRPGSGSPITLMTPEPTGGFYQGAGVIKFIQRFGYKDMHGREDRLNVGGIYKVGKMVSSTGLTLALEGFNQTSGKIDDVTKGITLITKSGECAAMWGYAGLISHWTRKHNRAVYIPSLCRTEPFRQYSYGEKVLLGSGADFLKVLKALAGGQVYYDPGIKLEKVSTGTPVAKRRSQFRVKWKDLSALYDVTESVIIS